MLYETLWFFFSQLKNVFDIDILTFIYFLIDNLLLIECFKCFVEANKLPYNIFPYFPNNLQLL
jgi:hypothetical protein